MLDLLRPHLTQPYDNVAALERMRWKSVGSNETNSRPLTRESIELLGLTNREAEVFLGTALGKTNKEIAASFYVSPLTVKTHLQHV